MIDNSKGKESVCFRTVIPVKPTLSLHLYLFNLYLNCMARVSPHKYTCMHVLL